MNCFSEFSTITLIQHVKLDCFACSFVADYLELTVSLACVSHIFGYVPVICKESCACATVHGLYLVRVSTLKAQAGEILIKI